ncbi:MAG: HD domain-containing phosphohydrolase [Rhodospirillaceae bacterium]
MTDDRQIPLLVIVDPAGRHRHQIAGALANFYRVLEFSDTEAAFRELGRVAADLILIDDLTPPRGGYEFVRLLRRDRMRGLSEVPMVITSRRAEPEVHDLGSECGADAWLIKPFRYSALMKCITSQLNRRVEARWEALPPVQRAALKGTLDVFNSLSEIIETGSRLEYSIMKQACAPLVEVVGHHDFQTLLRGVKEHDNYTYAHSVKVATMLCLFGHVIGLNQSEQMQLACGGLVHDTGKMMIPLDVLNKPGRLDAGELEVMRTHVPVTIEVLQAGLDIPKGAMIIAAQHHEKLDGTGYPHGLKGKEINELARMAAIVDVFSALTDRRPYKPPMTAENALTIMTGDMINHLDQPMVRMFRELMLDTERDLS